MAINITAFIIQFLYKAHSMAARTFEEIMADLFLMKEDLLKLHYAYSPEAANYHQIKQINMLRDQVKLAQEKLTAFQAHLQATKQTEINQQRDLEAENSELLTLNEQLVLSNEKFKTLLEGAQRQKDELQRQLQEEREGRRAGQIKYQKQMETLKLMQAQELYMLRKKEKKNL